MVKITGLWETKDKNGNLVLSGNLTPVSRLVILKNSFKREGKKDPDFFLHVDEIEQDKGQSEAKKE